jgi:hypothetical protein
LEVDSSIVKWRATVDEDGHYAFAAALLVADRAIAMGERHVATPVQTQSVIDICCGADGNGAASGLAASDGARAEW